MSSTKVKKYDPIAAAVAVLCEAFRQKGTEATVEAYRIGLEGISPDALKIALGAAIRGSRFMPSPAELRELAGEVTGKDRAVLAFTALDAAVLRHGYYHSVDFDDPLLNATVNALGGWEKVCDVSIKEWDSFFRNRFIDVYQAYAKRGVTADQAAPCIGFYDRSNGFNGYQSNHLHRIATGLPIVPLLHDAKRIESPRLRGPRLSDNGEVKGFGQVLDEESTKRIGKPARIIQ